MPEKFRGFTPEFRGEDDPELMDIKKVPEVTMHEDEIHVDGKKIYKGKYDGWRIRSGYLEVRRGDKKKKFEI